MGFRGRFALVVLGFAAIAIPPAVLNAQAPATQPTTVHATTEPSLYQPEVLTNPFAPGLSPTDVTGELQTIEPVSGAVFDWGIEELAPKGWRDGRTELRDKYGFDIGFAYTALYQQASGGPGERNAAGGDVDLFGTWRLIGTPEQNAGTIVWAADNRHALFTELTPQQLGPEIGTLMNTTDGFNERPFALRQLYWQQNLFDNKFTAVAGKLDPTVLYNGSRASNDNLLALNQSLSANPARFFPQEGIGFNLKATPSDMWYITAGMQDVNADGEQTGLNTAFDGQYFYAGEFGLTPKLNGKLEGIYRFSAWYNDPSDRYDMSSGWGVGFSGTQFITETAGLAVRYGWQSADDVAVEQVFSVQYLSFVGGSRFQDVWGVGAGWGQPSNSDLDDEYILELFYRLQLTRNAQLTPDVQIIANPSNSPDDDVLAVFGLRFRTAF